MSTSCARGAHPRPGVDGGRGVGPDRGRARPAQPQRVTHRNGYRPRDWDTRVGTVELAVPKLRQGSYFPSLLEPRRRAERALAAVVMQCYVEGGSTRRVDDLARSMGLEGISKSQVSRICGELDELVAAWRSRPLDTGPYLFVWIDALSMKVREGGRICNTAVLVATACNADGHREILGLDIGSAEDGASWTGFLGGLVARGLHGVRLVTSDAHQGSRTPSPRCWTAPPGSAAAPISCAICWPGCLVTPSQWWLRWSARSSPRSDPRTPGRSWSGWSPSLSRASSATRPGCWPTPPQRCWPTPPSPRTPGARSGPTIPRSGSTARSAAAPTWSASSPTALRSSGWSARSWPGSTTSGRWPAATWAWTSSAPASSPSPTAHPRRTQATTVRVRIAREQDRRRGLLLHHLTGRGPSAFDR